MAEYEKKVREILFKNNCTFKRHGKVIMIFGSAQLQTDTLQLILKSNYGIQQMRFLSKAALILNSD